MGGPPVPFVQEQHEDQRREHKIQPGQVRMKHAADQPAHERGRHPVQVIQQRYGQVKIFGGNADRRLRSAVDGKGLVTQEEHQRIAYPAHAPVAGQHAQAIKQVAGIDHQAHQKCLKRIKCHREKRNSHILHTAAEGQRTHQKRPQRAIALGGHQYAIGQPQAGKAHQNGQRVGKGGPNRGRGASGGACRRIAR